MILDGNRLDINIPVFNLTYTPGLNYEESLDFQKHAGPFCDDVSIILGIIFCFDIIKCSFNWGNGFILISTFLVSD